MAIKCQITGQHCTLMRNVYRKLLKPKLASRDRRYYEALEMMEQGNFRLYRKTLRFFPQNIRLAIKKATFFFRSHVTADLVNYLIDLDGKGRKKEIVDVLKLVPRNKWNETMFYIAGFAYIQIDEPETALELLHSMPSHITWEVNHFCVAAKAQDKLERYRENLDLLVKLPPLGWKNKFIVRMAANAHYKLGEFELALEKLNSLPMDKRDDLIRLLAKDIQKELDIRS